MSIVLLSLLISVYSASAQDNSVLTYHGDAGRSGVRVGYRWTILSREAQLGDKNVQQDDICAFSCNSSEHRPSGIGRDQAPRRCWWRLYGVWWPSLQ